MLLRVMKKRGVDDPRHLIVSMKRTQKTLMPEVHNTLEGNNRFEETIESAVWGTR